MFDDVGYYQSSDPLEYVAVRGARPAAVSSLGAFANDMIDNDQPKFVELMHHSEITFHSGVAASRRSTARSSTRTTGTPAGGSRSTRCFYDLKDHVPEIHSRQ